jgi:TPR repeat protein
MRPGPVAAGLSPTIVAVLLRRGNTMILNGDISGARRLYGHAAEAGSGEAALAMGKTYDPLFLAENGVRGMQSDQAAAIAWYRRALALGIGEARAQLTRHGVVPAN